MKKFLLFIYFLAFFISKIDAQVACGTCSNSNCKIYGPVTGTSFADASTKLSSGWSTYPDSYRYYLDPDPMIGGGIAKNGPRQFKNCYSIALSSGNSLGIKISSKQFLDPISFTINLYNASDVSCSAPISVSRNNGASSFSNNPEWDYLPAGNYKLCVDVNMQAGSVLTDFMVAYYTGVASTTPTNPNECGTCAVPDCKITHNTTKTNTIDIQVTDYNSSDFYTPTSPVSGKISTCHTLTSNANGTIGVRLSEFLSKPQPAQNIQGCSNAEADAIDLTRKYTLVEKNGTCPGVAVTPNVTNKANSATLFNPEWYGLKANTEYTLCIEVDVNQNPTCKMEKFGLVYYHPTSNIPPQPTPLPCGNVGIDWRNAANTPSASDYNNCVDKDFELKANSVIVAQQDIAPGFLIDNDFGKINLTKIELDQGQTGTYVNTNLVKDITFCSPNVGYNVRLTGSVLSTGSGIIRIVDHATGQDLYVGAFTSGMVIPVNAGSLKGTAVFSGPGVSNYRLNYPTNGATSYTGAGYGFFNPKKAGNGNHTITYSWNNGNQDCGTATIQVTVAGCSCTTDNGTQAIKINNATPPVSKVYATNSYGLCYDDVFTINTSNAQPGVDYAIYIGAPTSDDPANDPTKYSAVFFEQTLNSMSETSKGNTSPVIEHLKTTSYPASNNTVWWVPISTNTTGQYDANCFHMDYQNESYKVTYLNDIKITATETCASSKVSLKFEGGGPEFITGKKYNVITTNKGSLSAASVSSSGGTIDLTGLSQNDNYVINVTDEIGCTKSYTGTYTCACTAPTITGPSAICDLTTIEYTSNGTLISSDPSFASVTASGAANKYNVSAYKPTTASTNLKLTSTLNGCTTTKDITINPLPTATLSAPSPYTCGDYTVTANTGAGLTYEWYKSPSTTPIAGQTSSTFTATSVAGNGSYTVKVSDGTCSKTSSPLNISYVACNPCVQPKITAPIAKSNCEGTSVTYTVLPLPSGSTASSYQWQVKSPGGSWTDLTGEINGDLTLSNITNTMNGNQYQVIVKEATNACPLTSTPVGLTVNPIPTFTPSVKDICDGDDPSLTYTGLTGSPDKIIFDPNIPLVTPLSIAITASPMKVTGLPIKLPVNTYSGVKVKLENSTTGCKSTDYTISSFKVQATQAPSISAKGTDVSSVTFQWSDLTGLNTQSGGEDVYTVKEFICNGCSTPGAYTNATGTLSFNATSSKWEYLKNGLNPSDRVFIEVTPVDNTPLASPSCYSSSIFDLTAIPCDAPVIGVGKDLVDVELCEGLPSVAVPASFYLEYSLADGTTPTSWEILTPGGTWTQLNQGGVYTITDDINVSSKLDLSDIRGLDGTKFRVKLKTATPNGTCNVISREALLTVKPLPVMNVIADKSFCPGTLVNDPAKTKDFDFKITIAGTPTYTWTSNVQTTGVGTGGTDVNDFASFTTLSPSNDVISTITVTPTLNSCVGEAITFKITVKPTVKPIFSTPVTDFSSVKFTWSSSSVAPDFWNIDTAVTNSQATQPALNQYKTAAPIAGNINEYTINGISSAKKAYINVTPKQGPANTSLFCPVSDGFSGIPTPCTKPAKPADPIVNPVCEGAGIIVTGVSTDATADFQWKISTDGGATWNNVLGTDFGNTGTTNELSTQLTKSYMNNALVKVILTDKQTGKCTEESNTATLVINPLPNVKLIQPKSSTLCVNDDDEFAYVQLVSGKAPLKIDYDFDNVQYTNIDIANLELKFSTDQPKLYNLSINKVEDANGCTATLTGLTSAVTVHKIPQPSFSLSDTSGCYPDTIIFIDNSGDKFVDVTWDFGTGLNTSKELGSTENVYTKQGDYTITYTVVDEFGCIGQLVKEKAIHIYNRPTAVISASRKMITAYENEVVFSAKLCTDATIYKWDFGDNSETSTDFSPKHTYSIQEPGKYKVQLIASNSATNLTCSDTAFTWVEYPEDVVFYIPNSFTPNGDEFNNTFNPIFASGYDPQNYLFTIFNRWGEIVFETKNPEIGWDGTYGGKVLGNGTFVWKLGFKEKNTDYEYRRTGHVNLVR